MPSYLVAYLQDGERKTHPVLDVANDQAAKAAFMSLEWVGFSGIIIESVEPMLPEARFNPYRPRFPEPPIAAPKTSGPIPIGIDVACPSAKPSKPAPDWREYAEVLADRINKLADEAQKLTRAGKHDRAREKREEARKASAERARLIRQHKGK